MRVIFFHHSEYAESTWLLQLYPSIRGSDAVGLSAPAAPLPRFSLFLRAHDGPLLHSPSVPPVSSVSHGVAPPAVFSEPSAALYSYLQSSPPAPFSPVPAFLRALPVPASCCSPPSGFFSSAGHFPDAAHHLSAWKSHRSEERRVGKECIFLLSRVHLKVKGRMNVAGTEMLV